MFAQKSAGAWEHSEKGLWGADTRQLSVDATEPSILSPFSSPVLSAHLLPFLPREGHVLESNFSAQHI